MVQEPVVKFILNLLGDLHEHIEILIEPQSLVLVLLPLVLEVALDLISQLLVIRNVVVEFLAHSEEFRELVTLLKGLFELLGLGEALDELVHAV